ncbi:hypothetical protein [Cyanobium sp. ATX-6F1]|uniref:hypothetical protein n=1 Tax=Cyanobium sp. ATX-6F1 TaxID=3137388 RepID=UPI0039BDEC6B
MRPTSPMVSTCSRPGSLLISPEPGGRAMSLPELGVMAEGPAEVGPPGVLEELLMGSEEGGAWGGDSGG